MKWAGRVFLLLSLALLCLSCGRNPKKPNYEFMPEMVHSVAYDAFAPNPNTPTGQTLLQPVKGTIPRGYMPYPYPADEAGAQQAGMELRNPISFSLQVVEEGKALYQNFCSICHGVTGEGDGPLIPKFPNPPSFTTKSVRSFNPGRLYHVITNGSGIMASYASQVPPMDRWKIVYYVQLLQGKRAQEIKEESERRVRNVSENNSQGNEAESSDN